MTEVDGTVVRYRLLDTTRAYALEKLSESGERDRLARRHAEFYRDLFERAETEWETRPTAEWLADYGWRLDHLRGALHWAFSPNDDPTIGVALTAAAVPLWMHLSLLDECRSRVEQALSALEAGADWDARREMSSTPPWARHSCLPPPIFPTWVSPGQRRLRSRRASTIRSTNCGRSGAFTCFMPPAVGIASLWH
jgi:hypothetical protein